MMQLIQSIEIRYLRSVHVLTLNKLGDLTIFSGANDVGKSNILRALNLFFNNETDWNEAVEFYQDFSFRRLNEVRRESIKGKQFISIKVKFIRPVNYSGSLPPTFEVKKTWFRDGSPPKEQDYLESDLESLPKSLGTARRFLPQFLNRVHFEYVPAVKEKAYFINVLNSLQVSLLKAVLDENDPVIEAIEEFNESLGQRLNSLRDEFRSATSVDANIGFPEEMNKLFRSFIVNTRWGETSSSQNVSLNLRGDGIQARYIPSLLNYTASNSKDFYIWGFEEPENSVEYNLAIDLAREFADNYSKHAQIFVTTHSPAFISLQSDGVVSYRVFKDQDTTKVAQIYPDFDEETLNQLSEEIGLFSIQKELHEKFLERKESLLSARKQIAQLEQELAESTKPVVYLEGKTDVPILNTAWEKLYPDAEKPVEFKSCNPLPEEVGSAAGTGMLKNFLNSVRYDNPHAVIGIFDRDDAGLKGYRLSNNYTEDTEIDAKVCAHNQSAAFLLPIPPGREEYAEHKNLCIEYYFDDEVLEKRTEDARGLALEPDVVVVSIPSRNIRLSEQRSDDPSTWRITGNKRAFAEEIVPTLSPERFENFRLIFNKIDAILSHLSSADGE